MSDTYGEAFGMVITKDADGKPEHIQWVHMTEPNTQPTEEQRIGRYLSLTVDRVADAAYLALPGSANVAETRMLDSRVNVDFDDAGNVVGVELLSVDRGSPLDD